MKTTNILLRLILMAGVVLIPVFLFSQVTGKRADRNDTYTLFSETPYARQHAGGAVVPAISIMTAAVNHDTLHKTLRQLQDWGSRFMLNENRKEIATWLLNKFLSYGYTDVKLDSFYNILNVFGYTDSTWQYNVVCTLRGSSAPDEIYVIGGHYDSYSDPDPYTFAPGVDDNGSAVAATLEIARVMSEKYFHPEATVRFTLFAAEELGVYGSQYAAQKARQEGSDIRFMFSMDQIAHDPQNLNELGGAWYPGFQWACNSSAAAIERYTNLSVMIFNTAFNGGSDSYSYWTEGFPPFACIEKNFSPYEHTPADTLGNCNIPYLGKVTAGALATMAEQLLFPTPQGVIAHSGKTDITIQWKPTNNAFLKGVNVYRSDTTGGQYLKITQNPVSGDLYHDITAVPNRQYYYVLSSVNDSLQEGEFSEEVTGVRFSFCDTLLVLANLKGNLTTPDSVAAFYHAMLDTIPFVWQDVNAGRKVSLGLLSRYHSTLWITNTANFEVQGNDLFQAVSEFIANGGNVLFAGFNPMKFWTNGTTYPVKLSDSSLFHQLFKADSVDRKAQCLMFRANAVATGYDTLNVDIQKYSDKNYPGQIFNVEVFSPGPEARVIYRLDSKYDSTSSLGKMKHHPLGLEYMGAGFKSILLSFPLYYLDTNDARKFLHFVMTEKFIYGAGINPVNPTDPFSIQIYPNPAESAITIDFVIPLKEQTDLEIFNSAGKSVGRYVNRKGSVKARIDVSGFLPGLYLLAFNGKGVHIAKQLSVIR